MKRPNLKRTFMGGIVLFALIQFLTINRTNPPIEAEVPASQEVRAIMRRACYNCHSNDTVWPWYSAVAPVSWLVGHDVHEGREKLNFSTWNRLDAAKRTKMQAEVWKQVDAREMPPIYYRPLHPESHLSDGDRSILRDWSQAVTVQPPVER